VKRKVRATITQIGTKVADKRKLLSERRAVNGIRARMRDKMVPRHAHTAD